jgi:hypothetical protein
MIRMPQALKTRWLEDLRSGKYEQGEGQLISQDDGEPPKYCCLGVLCLSAGDPDELLAEDGHPRSVPTRAFAARHGIESDAKASNENNLNMNVVHDEDDVSSVTHLNDSGMSFIDIAALLEKNIEGT